MMMMDFYMKSVPLRVIITSLSVSHHFRHSGFLQIFPCDIGSLDINTPNDLSKNMFPISFSLASEML